MYNVNRTKIGILNLQGGVLEHLEHLEAIGVDGVLVKHAEQFSQLAGLIIPGGESTCLARLLVIFGLDMVIREHVARGMKVWGTCAGAILLATEIVDEEAHLGLLDISIMRNGFGSQLDSFSQKVLVPKVSAELVLLHYIRAPKIVGVGQGVEILLRVDDYIAAVESEQCLATVFHPELTECTVFHQYFAKKCSLNCRDLGNGNWSNQSWMKYTRV